MQWWVVVRWIAVHDMETLCTLRLDPSCAHCFTQMMKSKALHQACGHQAARTWSTLKPFLPSHLLTMLWQRKPYTAQS